MGNALAFGGPIFKTDYDMGLSFINTGGTHESNPYGGVTVGIAPDGLPNQVEEDEVIFNDYVFSNRLKVPKAIRNKYRLRKVKDLSFADALKQYIRKNGIEERNNDPIANRGLDAFASELAMEQEMLKMKRRMRRQNSFALGGHKFSGENDSRLYNTGTYAGKGNPWSTYTLPGVEKYFKDAVAQYQGITDATERANFVQQIMNNVNGLQNSFAGISNSRLGTRNDAIRAHQTMFNNMGGNYGFKGFESNIQKRYNPIAGDDDADNFTPDGVYGIKTSNRHFGANTPEDAEAMGRISELAKQLGLNWSPTLDYGSNGNKLYTLSLMNNDGVTTPVQAPNNLQRGSVQVNSITGRPEPTWSSDTLLGVNNPTFGQFTPIEFDSNNSIKGNPNDLRRMGLYANTAGLLYNLFDPYRPQRINEVRPPSTISAPHIGDYLEYTPYDINYATSQQDANSAATRNAIMQSALPGRDNLLLANDFNNNATRGATRRQALEYNDNARKTVADFNRGTNQFNAQMDLNAAARNQQARQQYYEDRMRQAQLNTAYDLQHKQARDQAIGQGIASIADYLNDMGREDIAENQVDAVVKSGVPLNESMTNLYTTRREREAKRAAERRANRQARRQARTERKNKNR